MARAPEASCGDSGYQGDFALAQGTDPTLWFYSQHYPSLDFSKSGQQMDLAIWDNGDARVLDSSTGTTCTTNCYSRATHFQLDESTRVASPLGPILRDYSRSGAGVSTNFRTVTLSSISTAWRCHRRAA